MSEVGGNAFVDDRIGSLQVAEGRIREDHAETEGIVATIAFDDPHLVVGVAFLDERGEVETSGSAADGYDLHVNSSP